MSQLNPVAEAPWVAKFLLFFMTMPLQLMQDEDLIKDCLVIWQQYVAGSSCPGTRAAIQMQLSLEGWPPAL